ncbi:MAG: glycosyltransferase [bacterium]
MNILFLNHNFENFGTYFRCFYLGKNLARMGHKVTLVCASKKNIDFFIRKKHIEKNFTIITLPRVKFHQYHTGHLLRAIINCFIVLYSRYDILHSFAIAQPTTAIPTVFAKIFKPYKKIVVDWDDAWAGGFGGYHPAIVNYILDYFERNIPKLADMVTVVSSFLERGAYKIGIDARKVVKIPNGANLEEIKPIDKYLARKKIGADRNAKILLSMGHTYMGNTMEFLMEAFKLVLTYDKSIKLMLVGGLGDTEKEIINNYKGICNNLILVGEVKQTDVPFYLGSADILLLSMEDNIIERARFPIRFGDYISCGRPIVSNAVGEIKNVIVEGNCGIATSHDSLNEFATAIKKILDDTDLQKKFSHNSRVYAEDKLNFKKITERLSLNYKQKLFSEYEEIKKRIMLISPFFSPNIGGVETHLDDLCYMLSERSLKTYVITYQPLTSRAIGKSFEKRGSVKIIRIRWYGYNLFHKLEKHPFLVMMYLFPGIFLKSFFFMMKHKNKISVIHSHGMLASFIAKIFKILFRKKIVMSTHAIYNFRHPSLFSIVIKHTLSSFDCILAISEQSKKELVNIGIKENKIRVYKYWVNQKVFRPMDKMECKNRLNWQGKFIVLFVGRLLEIKGVRLLVEASRKLEKNIYISIVGDGPLEDELRTEAECNNRLIFEGKVNNKDLNIYYNAADIVIVPSIYEEGYGRIILEALSCGTTVIASKRGGIMEALTQKVGILIKPTVENIVNSIDEVYQNEEKRAALSSCAREYALKNFNEKNADIIISSYYLR